MIWLWDNAMTLSTLVMAAAAIVALIYAHLQIAENEAETRANAHVGAAACLRQSQTLRSDAEACSIRL